MRFYFEPMGSDWHAFGLSFAHYSGSALNFREQPFYEIAIMLWLFEVGVRF